MIEVAIDMARPPLDLGPRTGTVSGKNKPKKRRVTPREDVYPIIEESNMEKFTATIIRDPARRSVNIHVEDKDGKFLMLDDTMRHERAMGAEMPLYLKLPEEIYNSILNAERLG